MGGVEEVTDLKIWLEDSNIGEARIELDQASKLWPENVGYLDFGTGFHLYLTERPNRWKRFWYRFFFGWEWVDER